MRFSTKYYDPIYIFLLHFWGSCVCITTNNDNINIIYKPYAHIHTRTQTHTCTHYTTWLKRVSNFVFIESVCMGLCGCSFVSHFRRVWFFFYSYQFDRNEQQVVAVGT